MKKCTFFISLLAVVAGSAIAEKFDIRKVRWGMSPNEVVASETWEYRESVLDEKRGIYRITYHGQMLRVKCALIYYFTESSSSGELTKVRYTFLPEEDAGRSIFLSLLETLQKKYGKPTSVDNKFGAPLAKIKWITRDKKTHITLDAGLFVVPGVIYESREFPKDL